MTPIANAHPPTISAPARLTPFHVPTPIWQWWEQMLWCARWCGSPH